MDKIFILAKNFSDDVVKIDFARELSKQANCVVITSWGEFLATNGDCAAHQYTYRFIPLTQGLEGVVFDRGCCGIDGNFLNPVDGKHGFLQGDSYRTVISESLFSAGCVVNNNFLCRFYFITLNQRRLKTSLNVKNVMRKGNPENIVLTVVCLIEEDILNTGLIGLASGLFRRGDP